MKYIPNILSIIRAVLACIIFALIALINPVTDRADFLLFPGVLFLIACLTDTADGQIARKKNIVSDFGKFIDPVADKILVSFTMIAFMYIDADRGLPILFISIAVTLLREFAVSSLRMMAAKNGTVIAADWAGKVKAVLQMVALGTYFFFVGTDYIWLAQILMGIATVVTVISGYAYFHNYYSAHKQAK